MAELTAAPSRKARMAAIFAAGAAWRCRKAATRFVRNGAWKNGACAPIRGTCATKYWNEIVEFALFVASIACKQSSN